MIDDAFELEYVDLTSRESIEEIRAFLARFDLTYLSGEVERTVAVRVQSGKLVATGSSAGEILRNIAIDDQYQGEGLTATILSELMQDMARAGILHYFIFTRPSKAVMFEALGFREIGRAEPYAALLESGFGSVASYCDGIREKAREAGLPEQRAAIVMNANPFTKGHRALISRAAAENGGVIVFVVEEDRSLVPFRDRIQLVRAGTADLKNVLVVPGGKYIISNATFPTYFTHKEDLVVAQTRLDVTLFATQMARRLGVTARYVGEEPYCATTAIYNEALKDILPGFGVQLHLVPRVQEEGEVVSASTVREMIRQGEWDRVQQFVPETTLAYLLDGKNSAVIEKIRQSPVQLQTYKVRRHVQRSFQPSAATDKRTDKAENGKSAQVTSGGWPQTTNIRPSTGVYSDTTCAHTSRALASAK